MLVNIDQSKTLDKNKIITDLRSVGNVIVKMLTKTEIKDLKYLSLLSNKIRSFRELYKLQRISKDRVKRYRFRKLSRLITALERCSIDESDKKQLKRCRQLSLDVGSKQLSALRG